MKSASIICLAVLAFDSSAARAQAPPPPTGLDRFATFNIGPTFTHKTGALFGVEFGWPLNLSWDVVVEGGRMLNADTSDLHAAASIITDYLASTEGSAGFKARQPATYIDGGLRYKVPATGRFLPYVGLNIGVARVTRKVTFIVNDNDVTTQLLDNFGVQLGTDLAGHETKPLIMFGLGAQFNIRWALLGDVSYRYAHVFLSPSGLNTNRLQFGVGKRF